MFKKIYDISVPLSPEIPCWPGSHGVHIERLKKIEEGSFDNASLLTMDVHCGTHVDAPWHFVPNGKKLEELKLDLLIGVAHVVAIPEVSRIDARLLDAMNIPGNVKRLLFKTDNSSFWRRFGATFQEDFCALTSCAAQWVVDHSIEVVGIDYLSIQKYQDGPQAHQILLENEVVIIEGLNLLDITPGIYELICTPIFIKNAEAAPARALLRDI